MKKKITLRQARLMSGKTLRDVAKLIGVHFQTLRDYELGNTSPTIETTKKLCAVYGIELDDLEI